MASGPGYAKHPHHTVTLELSATPVKVTRGGYVLASSDRAVILREADYPPVAYIPREDISLETLEPQTNVSYCPFKGEASYFAVTAGGEPINGGAWTYVEPYDEVADIAGHIAFYPVHVSFEGMSEVPPAEPDMDTHGDD